MSDEPKRPDAEQPEKREKQPGLRDLVGRAVDRLGEWLFPAPEGVPVPVRVRPRRR
jgi:hypothetical protein